jgi:hypothetical protein
MRSLRPLPSPQVVRCSRSSSGMRHNDHAGTCPGQLTRAHRAPAVVRSASTLRRPALKAARSAWPGILRPQQPDRRDRHPARPHMRRPHSTQRFHVERAAAECGASGSVQIGTIWAYAAQTCSASAGASGQFTVSRAGQRAARLVPGAGRRSARPRPASGPAGDTKDQPGEVPAVEGRELRPRVPGRSPPGHCHSGVRISGPGGLAWASWREKSGRTPLSPVPRNADAGTQRGGLCGFACCLRGFSGPSSQSPAAGPRAANLASPRSRTRHRVRA